MEKFSDQGEYHDPALRIEHTKLERTDLAQQEFNRQCPDVAGKDIPIFTRAELARERARRIQAMTTHIMQSIIAESPYAPDMQWTLWHQARVLEDENALPDGVSAEDVFLNYMRVFEGE